MTDALRNAIPHSIGSTFRLGLLLVLTTLAMIVADQRLHIVNLGVMSADNAKDNLVTLGFFVPIGLFWLFVLYFFAEGLFLVPYKMWREMHDEASALKAEKALRSAKPRPDWPITSLLGQVLVRLGGDDPFDAAEAIRDACALGDMEIWGRRGVRDTFGDYLQTGALERIPTEYWREHEFDTQTMYGAPHAARTRPTVDDVIYKPRIIYMDLQVNQFQAMAVRWSAAENDADAAQASR